MTGANLWSSAVGEKPFPSSDAHLAFICRILPWKLLLSVALPIDA